MNHYVYRITNKVLSKHYYGIRSCKCLPTEDLGKTYLSSSKDKQFIADQKARPANYKYKIVRVTSCRASALELEIKLHNKFNVGVSPSFYNKSKQSATGFDTSGVPNTPSQKLHKHKLFSGAGNPFFGKKHSEATKQAIALNHAPCTGSDNAMFGKTHSASTRALIGDANSGSNNGNASTILIYNSNDALMYTCNGTFNTICTENNLPKGALRKTYIKGTKMTNPHKRNKEFTGWYAYKVK